MKKLKLFVALIITAIILTVTLMSGTSQDPLCKTLTKLAGTKAYNDNGELAARHLNSVYVRYLASHGWEWNNAKTHLKPPSGFNPFDPCPPGSILASIKTNAEDNMESDYKSEYLPIATAVAVIVLSMGIFIFGKPKLHQPNKRSRSI